MDGLPKSPVSVQDVPMSAPTLLRSPSSPVATRAARPGWRDPRLALGIGLVAVCAVLGARLLGSADDTVEVWALRSDGVAGTALEQGDLERTRVHFGSSSAADAYLRPDDDLADRPVLTRPVGAGELLPKAALGEADTLNLIELPLVVAANAVPATVRPGSIVDVWVTPEDDRTGGRAGLVLDDVPVLALPGASAALSASAESQVIVGLDDAAQAGLANALSRVSAGTVLITRQAGR